MKIKQYAVLDYLLLIALMTAPAQAQEATSITIIIKNHRFSGAIGMRPRTYQSCFELSIRSHPNGV